MEPWKRCEKVYTEAIMLKCNTSLNSIMYESLHFWCLGTHFTVDRAKTVNNFFFISVPLWQTTLQENISTRCTRKKHFKFESIIKSYLFDAYSFACYTFFPSLGQSMNTTPVIIFPICRVPFIEPFLWNL